MFGGLLSAACAREGNAPPGHIAVRYWCYRARPQSRPYMGVINMDDFAGVLGTVVLLVGMGSVAVVRLPTITLFGGEQ